MKKLLAILLITMFTISCSKYDNNSTNNQATNQTTTSLEGVWRLQNLTGGAKLTFQGLNWTLNSGTVTIKGTFTLTNNQMSGVATSRTGTSSNLLQPDNFTGNVSISNNKVTFTNFSGNWVAPFSTWYQKQ